jgi:hypothetical protein
VSSAPVDLSDVAALDSDLGRGRQRVVPEAILALGQRSEYSRVYVAAGGFPAQHIRVHALSVISLRADLDFLTSQGITCVDNECTRTRSDIHHDALLELCLAVVLGHGS